MTAQSTVSDILKDQFGNSLESASLTQKLVLMEATDQAMRTDSDLGSALGNLDYSTVPVDDIHALEALDFPEDLTIFQDANEGLQVMSFLVEGIVEDYSVLAAEERLTD